MSDLLQDLRALGDDAPEETVQDSLSVPAAAPVEPGQTASSLQEEGHFDAFISGLGARKALGNDAAFVTSRRNEAQSDVDTWEKELRYKQDLAESGDATRSPEFRSADIVYAKIKRFYSLI